MTGHGTQFTSKKWTDKLIDNGIKPIFSSVRHPQSNIDKIMKILNETHHDSTGYTPLILHFNKKPTQV